jgi:hypothetical protein
MIKTNPHHTFSYQRIIPKRLPCLRRPFFPYATLLPVKTIPIEKRQAAQFN